VSTRKRELVDVAGEVRGETDLAYRFFDGERTVWLPKSQCEWDADAKVMTMPEWVAVEKELV
jgi:hypothetical protein